MARALKLDDAIERLAGWVAASEHLVAFTGAGISTDSGIPDYRGPDGVWTRRDRGLPPPRWRTAPSRVKPNRCHEALVALQDLGKLQLLVSQNVDGLHLRSGIRAELLVELHGNQELMRCLACDASCRRDAVGWDRRRWGDGYRTDPVRPGAPPCPACGGRLISSIVNFGDPMPERELALATEHARRADVFLALGSSLVVSPANDLPRLAAENGARLVIANLGETPLDDLADLRVTAGLDDLLPPVVRRVREALGR